MKNTLGVSVKATLFGESHGAAVGLVLDGLAPGLPVSEEEIARQLTRRRPSGGTDTARREKDAYQIVSGVFEGRTTGTPLTLVIPNEDTHSRDYQRGPARPAHADYAAYCKYHGYEDYRGGGHFSGRVTAALVAAGGILLPALEKRGVTLGTRILRCAGVEDRPFGMLKDDLEQLKNAFFPVLDEEAGQRMQSEILRAAAEQDSVGGVIQTVIAGLPAGLGEPWFDSVEGDLALALFGVGGVKGIEFGDGFGLCGLRGSQANDAFRLRDGNVVTETNRNGGVNGGITNGMPVVFQCAVKPTPSISRVQKTVDFLKMEETDLEIRGRHDPAIIRRICPVVDSVTALVLCDLLARRYGTDWLAKEE